MTKNIENNFKDSNKITGGIIEEKSTCCNAPLIYINKGVNHYRCSKCGKRYEEPLVVGGDLL